MTRAATLAAVAVVGWSGCVPDAGQAPRTANRDVYQLLVDTEDARPSTAQGRSLLLDASAFEDPFYRRVAVRALGRLEDAGLAQAIAGYLPDANAEVREVAAQALAQSVHGGDGGPVLDDLLARVGPEPDPAVRGTLARSVGRLRLDESDRRRVSDALVTLGGEGPGEPLETLLGVALGFESLVRLSDGSGLSRPAADLLTELMTLGRDTPPPPEGDDRGRIRALAASALGRTRRLSLDLIEGAQGDPEPEVRRAVLPFLNAVPPRARARLVARALSDTSARVAIEAVRHLAASPRTAERCDHLIAAAAPDSDPAVRITALEALASGCPNYSAQRAALVAIASALGERDGSWQPPARALLSLATIDPGGAAGLLGPFAEHENAFVRAWAARAAARIPDTETLFTLTLDPSPNVSTEAIQGLFAIEEHDIDGALLQQLEGNDPQLLMTVAGLLEGAPDRQTVSRSLVSAFERISAAERETWRDPRLALLERIAELGDPPLAARLSPFLQDYDPLVAERVGTILASWTGREQQVEPQPLPRAPVPTLAEVRALDGATLTLHRSGGGSLVIELLAEQAPTNVARLVRLAEAGYYDGLTFHRWEANFVIQGGSPSAHEYQGDGPYTRDEVGGLPHFRGTVGLSTRGRDTGDGQIFVNLVDNPRLDHDYTVVGRLVDGYDVLDDILEGDVIERAVVARAR